MNELRSLAAAQADAVSAVSEHDNDIYSIVEARMSRRQVLSSLTAATSVAVAGMALSACDNNDSPDVVDPPVTPPVTPPLALGFAAVAKSLEDAVKVPDGYSFTVLHRLGDPINTTAAAYKNDGTDTDFDQRAGDHHDGMHFFGLAATGTARDDNANDRGLLVMNHENITQAFLHVTGATTVAGARPEAEAKKEIDAHGVAIVEVKKNAAGKFETVPGGALNRRITPNTPIALSGPVRGSKFVVTKYSPAGTDARGTVNNCANGYTPWGTYLTAEENWPGYFRRVSTDNALRSPADVALFNRLGVTSTSGSYSWSTVVAADASNTTFSRWNASITDATSTTGATDFRNEPNTYGYIVEIDPYNKTSVPKKRTALGRFSHEGCWPGKVSAGQPVVFYMGDDNRGDYVYKFVSTKNWDPADANKGLTAGDKYMDDGTLYVAKFNSDGTGQWIALQHGSNGLTADNALYPFTSQAAVIIATRLAADSVGATKMDRPEWAVVNPSNGEVYLTLTNNNAQRGTTMPLDAANPRNYDSGTDGTRDGNPNGHILRWREDSDTAAALTFKWDIYLFGSPSTYDATNINVSGLTADNDLSSPDGFGFGPNGLAWIQTDDGAYTSVTNCMLLAAVPGKVGDGGKKTIVSGATSVDTYVGKAPGTDLRRFLVGPKGCELTGITWTPDGKTMFVNIQHPGEDIDNTKLVAGTFQSNWPQGGTARPRSATLAITKNDGGVVGA